MADSDSKADGIYDVLEFLKRGTELLGSANRSGETLLMAAAYHGRLDWVNCLIDEPAARQTINARDCDGVTALMQAAVAGHAEVVRSLLRVDGIHLYYRTCENNNAMQLAE